MSATTAFLPERIKIMDFNLSRGRGHARIYMSIGLWVSVGIKISLSGRVSLELPSAVFPEFHGFPVSPTVGLDREKFTHEDFRTVTEAWTRSVVYQLKADGHAI